MLKTRAVFERKMVNFEPKDCEIEKTIRLTGAEYDCFAKSMLRDQDFIKENVDLMRVDTDGVSHCLLVTGEGRQDGILVQAEGYDYARCSAFIPNASDFLKMQEVSPALSDLVKRIEDTAQFILSNIEKNAAIGEYSIDVHEIEKMLNMPLENNDQVRYTLTEMLSENVNYFDYDLKDGRMVFTFDEGIGALIQSENYKKLCGLAPEFMNGNEEYAAFVSPHDPTRLIELYRYDGDNPKNASIEMTQTVQSGGHQPITDIKMGLAIDKDAGIVRALDFQRDCLVEPQSVHSDNGWNHKMEAEHNLFLSDWIKDIQETGFEQKQMEQDNGMGMDAPY